MRFRPRYLLALSPSLLIPSFTSASVTVYTNNLQLPLFQTEAIDPSSSTPAFPKYTNAAGFDPVPVDAPAPPSPAITTSFPVQLFLGGMNGLSIPQSGAFMGFSIELSVANTVFGSSGSRVDPIFLNLLANIKARAGRSVVRVGGNTQEKAVFFPDGGLPNGSTIIKTGEVGNDPTDTPTIEVSVGLIEAMATISKLVNTQWFVGVPFNDTSKPRLEIAESSEKLLGEFLLGFQLGNEPDLYPGRLRPDTYNQTDYINDFTTMVQAIQDDNNISNKTNLIGPSVCCQWTPDSVFDAGYLDKFGDQLAYLAVERCKHPDTHCTENNVTKTGAQAIGEYLSHALSVGQMQNFITTANHSVQSGKPLIMMETNTASCGGFPGFSDTFGAALWGIDWGLQMAYYNFSGAMMHLGGQNVYYNPFTPPPTNLAGRANWTVGPTYYSALIVSEVFGPSNNSRIVDLFQNSNNPLTPGYAIYEDGAVTKVALINFIDDPSGANNYTANISIGGSGANQTNGNPSQVTVKYFTADSVVAKDGFQWAGQTFGGILESNGILQGKENIVTIPCQSDNVCSVPVPAPGFALVFFTDDAFQASSPSSTVVKAFPTTVTTVTVHTHATIPIGVLETSNGHGGKNQPQGSTSEESANGERRLYAISGIVGFVSVVLGVLMTAMTIAR
ncbi:glycoside hydrolase family 79 protein [Sphaerobolus stellatus SS14]|nr:glycoside hydrolase family 79 protein [Sphaerobolus stellatus SS14]